MVDACFCRWCVGRFCWYGLGAYWEWFGEEVLGWKVDGELPISTVKISKPYYWKHSLKWLISPEGIPFPGNIKIWYIYASLLNPKHENVAYQQMPNMPSRMMSSIFANITPFRTP